MKTVVITGSTRGLGFEMAKCFKAGGWNVVINGVDSERLKAAIHRIVSLTGCRDVYGILTNGGFSGITGAQMRKIVKQKGMEFKGYICG